MCDLYPLPSTPELQNLLSYDDFEDYNSESDDYITASGLTIVQLDSVPPKHSIPPQAFVRELQCQLSNDHDHLTFAYVHNSHRMNLIFNEIPDLLLLMKVFCIVTSKLVYFELEGIDEVIFNAGKDDEVVFQNVSSMLQQNMTIIPAILDFVQTHYRTTYLND
ncbi:hypothetical protein [Hymenobacter sp. B1770]|uniref:hypothetical protein n=1 Tax=Hymenobacter sp. B1770 TaxID=1718788 RepID=UPI003CEB3916